MKHDQLDRRAQWYGDLPKGWQIVSSKRLFAQRKEKAKPGSEQLTASQVHGIISQKEFMALEGRSVVQVIKGEDILKNVEVDDFVISMRSFQGGLEFSRLSGSISSAYVMLKPEPGLWCGYYRHLFKSDRYIRALQATSNLVRDGQAMRYSNFTELPLPVPPNETQKAIAEFLDRETARIDALIEKKERQVHLLALASLSATEEAISIGGVPTRLGFHIDVLPGFAFPSAGFSEDEDDIRLLRGANVSPGRTQWKDTVYWPQNQTTGLEKFALNQGDIVLGMDRPWISTGIRVAKITRDDLPALLLQRVCKVVPKGSLDADFLHALLSSKKFLGYFEPELTGVSVPHISGEQIEQFRFKIPSLELQQRAAKELEIKLTATSETSILVGLSVTKLREYRSALITAAVTGQIDVNTWRKSGQAERQLDQIGESSA